MVKEESKVFLWSGWSADFDVKEQKAESDDGWPRNWKTKSGQKLSKPQKREYCSKQWCSPPKERLVSRVSYKNQGTCSDLVVFLKNWCNRTQNIECGSRSFESYNPHNATRPPFLVYAPVSQTPSLQHWVKVTHSLNFPDDITKVKVTDWLVWQLVFTTIRQKPVNVCLEIVVRSL